MSRQQCIDCPQQHEPVCCHKAIDGLDEYSVRVSNDAERHVKVSDTDNAVTVSIYHVLIPNVGGAQ